MKLLTRWTTPDMLTATKYDDRWRWDEPLPRVVIVADSFRLNADWARGETLEKVGYRYLEPMEWLRTHRFVRGWWLWMLHRAGCWLWNFSIRVQYWWESPADGTPWPKM